MASDKPWLLQASSYLRGCTTDDGAHTSVKPWGKTHVHSVCAQSTCSSQPCGYAYLCWLRMVVGMCARAPVCAGGGRQRACDVCGCERLCWQLWEHLGCRAGRPWCDCVCKDLIESPGWLVVCCSWGAVHHSWVSPRGPPDSGVPLGQLKLS